MHRWNLVVLKRICVKVLETIIMYMFFMWLQRNKNIFFKQKTLNISKLSLSPGAHFMAGYPQGGEDKGLVQGI